MTDPPADLAAWLVTQRWFAGKARRIRGVAVQDRLRVGPGILSVVAVGFDDAPAGDVDRYLVTLTSSERAEDALDDPAFCRALLDVARRGETVRGERGTLSGRPGRAFPRDLPAAVAVRRLHGEQSNTSVVIGEALIMKVFRRLADGINPDVEITRFLTEHTAFTGTPRLAATLEYAPGDGTSATLAMVQEFVADGGDGWRWMLERLAAGDRALAALARLGERTGALHAALATPTADAAFGAEPITAADVVAWADGVRRQVEAARRAARGRTLPAVPDVGGPAGLGALVGRAKIRHHGDFHLGQTLAVGGGRDFAIIDFEGEPLRPLAERRGKHTPLRDVAGMLRSFGYAAASADLAPAERTAWERDARAAYLRGYRAVTAGAPFVPPGDAAFAQALAVLEVEKAAYEIVYEANNRPNWLDIPLAGFLSATAALGRPAGAA
ncbi:MAG TPA: phosphotransferase [Methylomirabilota bacterium]|jgi:predicted trehalose synthase|nr:phosphotransferase [Methylomirabilota bacterium]